MIFAKDFEIGLKDVGRNNELTNKSMMLYLEDTAGKHADGIMDGVNDRKRTKTGWLILDWKIKVIKRPKYGQTLNILTWGRKVKRCYIYRDFEVYNDDNEICAIATSKWLLVNIETKKLVQIPEELIQRYDPEYNTEVFKNEDLNKLKKPEDILCSSVYKVGRRDIDINNHVHNLYYLDYAYEALPEDVYKNNVFNNIRIMYKKEIKLGEKIKCEYVKEKDKHIVSIVDEDDTILHAIIELS